MKVLIGSMPVDVMAGAALGPISAANSGPGVGVLAWDLFGLEHNGVGQSVGAGESIGEPIDANCTSTAASGPVVPAIQNAAPAAATPATNAVRASVELRIWGMRSPRVSVLLPTLTHAVP
jgi:hypothetical protein